MNKRIKKKRQKLEAICHHKWKYLKRIKKRAHATRIEVRHGSWGMFPDKDNYTMYLRKKRRGDKLEATIEKHFVFSEMLYMVANEHKKVKEKMFLKEGNCDFEGKPLPDGFIIGRLYNGQREISAAVKIPMLPAETQTR